MKASLKNRVAAILATLALGAAAIISSEMIAPHSAYADTATVALTNQAAPNFYFDLTNFPQVVTNGTTLSIATQPFTVRPHTGFSVFTSFVNISNGTAANLILRGETTADGTTWTTTGPLLLTNASAGTNPVVGWNLVTPLTLDNVRQVRFTNIVNAATNNVTVSRVRISYDND